MLRVGQIACVILGSIILTSPAFAQQKTVKACQEEWRSNKAANQAAGIKEKDYVAQCRTGAAPTAAAPAQAPATTPAPSTATRTAPAAPSRPAPPAASPPMMGGNQFTSEAQAKARCPMG